jgi:PAS domain S-box-containing protein
VADIHQQENRGGPGVWGRSHGLGPNWLGVIPLILVAALTASLAISGASPASAPSLFFPLLNTLFIFTTYTAAAFYCGRVFLRTGSWQILLMGTGLLIFGVSGTLTAWLSLGNGTDVVVKIHNLCALAGSLLVLTVPACAWRGASPRQQTGRPKSLAGLYAAGPLLVGLVTLLTFSDSLIPPFFTAAGFTLLRQTVFGTAALLTAVSAVWMALNYARSRSGFPYWCSLGLGLVALCFTTSLFTTALGDTISWLSRITIYFSGIYFIVAGLTARAEARVRGMDVPDLIAEFGRQARVNYEFLVRTAPDAIVAVDGLGRVLAWNSAAENLFGYRWNEITGKLFFDLTLSPEEADAYRKAAEKISRQATPTTGSVTIELKARRKNGVEFPVSITLATRNLVNGWFVTTNVATTTTTTLIIRDLSRRRKAEEALRESEERFRSVLENSRDIIIRFNEKAGCYDYVSPSVETMTGYKADEFVGMDLNTALTMVHPDDMPVMREARKHAEATGAAEAEYRQRTKQGDYIWISNRMSVVRDAGGRPLYRYSNLRDITANKKDEAARRESEERFFKAFRFSPAGMTIASNERWVDVNDSFLRMTEYTREEVVGHSSTELNMFPDRAHREQAWQGIDQKGKVTNQELTLRTRSGRLLTVLCSNEKIYLDGRDHYISSFIDITAAKRAEAALRESEERFRVMADSSPFMIRVDGADGMTMLVNKAYTDFFGITQEQVQGKFWKPVLHPDDAEQYLNQFMASLEGHKPFHTEARVRRADGEWRWLESFAEPRFSSAGEFEGMVGGSLDITERKKTETLKDEFIGLVSHELRTPLTIFLSAVKVAQSTGLTPEEVGSLLKEAAESAEEMAHLVENLLELSRFQANRLVLNPTPLDATTFVRTFLADWKTGRKLILKAPEGLPPLEVDRVRLEEVLHNLLDNADKYSPAGTEIQVSVEKSGDYLLFGVKDRGPGISEEEQCRLFQPFERLKQQSTDRPGLGLGLLVCKRLVEAMGGKIWAESGSGEGSTFWFTLPVAPA